MQIKNLYILMVSLMIGIFIGCDKNPTGPEFQKEIVIHGFLWANKYVDTDHAIMVNYTSPIDNSYNINDAAIQDAVVTLKNHSTGEDVQLKTVPHRPGFYFNEEVLIQPNKTYSIKVETGGKTTSATTTVPPELILTTDLEKDNINRVYREDLGVKKPVELKCENEEQIIYVDMFCNESWENAEFIDNFGPHDKPEDREQYDQGKNSQPRHIEAFMRMKDLKTDFYPGDYVVFWYHSMIIFYGSNTMQIMAIDDNYHNFLHKEHPELNGGVNGGIGVFGSVCGEDFDFLVIKK